MKATRRLAGCLLVALALLGGCTTVGKGNPDEFAAYVKATWDKYSAHMIAEDAEGWIALWDEEGVQLPPGAPMVVGRPAIRKAIDASYGSVNWEAFSIKISGTFVDHDLGFAYGNYTFTVQPRAGGPKVLGDGKYETIFRRQADGSWKIFRDCFNSNVP
jgi:ketosteroid isomerase-like protein